MKVLESRFVLNPKKIQNKEFWGQCLAEIQASARIIRWPKGNKNGFVIFPESGKKRGKGNGVKPIKEAFLEALNESGWRTLDRANPERFDAVKFLSQPHKLDNQPLSKLGLPKKQSDVLTAAGIETIGDLVSRTKYELSKIKGFGKKSLVSLTAVLKEENLLLIDEFPYVGVEWETGNVSSGHRSVNRILRGEMRTPRCMGGVVVAPTKNLAQYLTDRVSNYEELLHYAPVWNRMTNEWGIPVVLLPIEQDETSNDSPKIKKGTDGRNLL
jgi:hypothetical protein